MSYTLLLGDCIETMRTLPSGSVQCCVTSPPYFGLRSYLPDGHEDKCMEIGTEETPEQFVAKLVEVFREVRRLLRDDGTLWLNLGDSYVSKATGNVGTKVGLAGGSANKTQNAAALRPDKTGFGLAEKQLLGIPWRVAFAIQADGWWLRSEIIWHKKAPMPESVTDRPTKAHEQLFLLSKSQKYYYDADAIAEPTDTFDDVIRDRDTTQLNNTPGRTRMGGLTKNNYSTRNKRDVWTLGPELYYGAHFATMPTKLVEPCILAGSAVGDTVLDPFFGSGTVGAVALKHGRNFIGCDIDERNIELAHERIAKSQPMLFEVPT